VVEALDEPGHGALARAAAAHDADHLAGLDGQTHPVEHQRPVVGIAELDVPEHDRALEVPKRHGAARHLRGRVDDVADPLEREPRLLEVLPQVDKAQDGAAELRGEHLEGDELAHAQAVVEHEAHADGDHGERHELLQGLRGGDGDVAHVGEVEGRLDVVPEVVLPVADHPALEGHGLHRLDPRDGLDQEGLRHGPPVKLLVEPGLDVRRGNEGHDSDDGHEAEHQQGERHAVEGHDGDEDDGEDRVEEHRERDVGHELPEVLQLPHPGDDGAHPPRLEVAVGQRQQVPVHPGTQPRVDLVGRVVEQVVAQEVHAGLEDDHREEGRRHDLQRGDGVVGQHLVDDDLDEQRRHEPEGLDEERGAHDLVEDGAEAEELHEEPLEAARELGLPEPRPQRDDLPGPEPPEALFVHLADGPLGGVEDEALALLHPDEDVVAPLRRKKDLRQRVALELLEARDPAVPRLEAVVAQDADHLLRRELPLDEVLLPDGLDVHRDGVDPCRDFNGDQSRFHPTPPWRRRSPSRGGTSAPRRPSGSRTPTCPARWRGRPFRSPAAPPGCGRRVPPPPRRSRGAFRSGPGAAGTARSSGRAPAASRTALPNPCPSPGAAL